MQRIVVAFVLVSFFALGCGGGGGDAPGGGTLQAAPLVVAAGMQAIEPVEVGAVDPSGIDVFRLGVPRIDARYELTTPAGMPFTFDVVTRAEGNAGSVRVSVAHGSDGGRTPSGGVETLAGAGIVPSGTGVFARGVWLDAAGDGFSRFTASGEIVEDQVLVVETNDGAGTTRALIHVRIGAESPINAAAPPGTDDPGVVESRALYSSDSWRFGLPTVAVSGDRTSVVVYEGDRSDPFAYERYEMRLQLDHATGAVTGGGEVEPSVDSGHWRDHEIAALFNVLALVRSGTDDVTVQLSFDRGATIGQTARFPGGGSSARLVQTTMADDYTLAVLFWRGSRLLFVEGRPSQFDDFGSPSRFAFDAPVLLHGAAGDVTPFLMGAQYSGTGDLAVAYGFTAFTRRADGTWISDTQYRCATRRFGVSAFTDRVIESERLVGRDPSVAIDGERLYYVLEAADGVHLWTSPDFGTTWTGPVRVGTNGAHMPTVFARPGGRIDVLYLSWGENGTELHRAHWSDFATGVFEDHRLTRAERIESGDVPDGNRVPGAGALAFVPPDSGFRIRQVAWFGYDAALDGDDLVIVYDEETYDAYTILDTFALGLPVPGPGAPAGAEDQFMPADPPPLAAGLTEPLPPADEEDLHVLRFLRVR